MNDLIRTVENAIQTNDYASLSSVFSGGPSSWIHIGQGEQRSLAAHFVKTSVASPAFFPKAFESSEVMHVLNETLSFLPSTVENAADSKLRNMLFTYLVHEASDYAAAARILGGMRMEDDSSSVYYTPPAEKCDVYVKIAECFLEEDEIAESDSAVSKAGGVVKSIPNPEQHMALILRYKSTYARVLDANRKFLQAAQRYYDLSQSAADLIDADDLLAMLGRAVTCAILAPSGPQRRRVLGHLYSHERLSHLDSIPAFETHSTILKKMYMNQILKKDELVKFEATLAPHQKAIMGDGLTIMERGVVEHNMIAVSKLYQSIYMSELARILGVNPSKAEKIAADMIMGGSLHGSIDQVDGLLEFHMLESANSRWDRSITSFCQELNRVTEAIKAE